MREKTRVTASLLVLALHLISREDGANFLDQSQSLVKQHGQLLLALKRFHKTNLRQVCFLTLLAVEVCPRAKILRNNDFRYVKFTYLHCGEETNSWLVSSVGRALHRYCRGHGFKSRTGLNFFRSYFQLLVQ